MTTKNFMPIKIPCQQRWPLLRIVSQHNSRHEAQSDDPWDHAYKNSVSPN